MEYKKIAEGYSYPEQCHPEQGLVLTLLKFRLLVYDEIEEEFS
jgi:hypothetical protein